VIFISFMLGVLFSVAQYDGSITPVSPVTPNAAALFKPTERPLGSFSGTVPVSIPLYTLQLGGMKVPISLNYAMGGIKVEEVASNVGLGWSLAAGGSITRVMNGIPDDENGPGTGYLYSTVKPSTWPGSDWMTNVNNVLRNYGDIEPDIYYFSYNGNSGKFFFDESGNVIMDDQNGIKILPVFTSSTIVGWIITELDGTKYYFGSNKDKSLQSIDYVSTAYTSVGSLPNGPTQPGYNNNWHLMEIRDMNEENVVTFQYGVSNAQYTSMCGAYTLLAQMGGTVDCMPRDYYTDELKVTTYVTEHYPTKISSRAEYLNFSSSTDRTDYMGASKLNTVSLYDSAGVLKKKYGFNYTLFSAGSGADQYMKRLKLKGVSEFGGTGTDSLAYTFDYYEDMNLPSRISYAVDYWGYYNGQTTNYTYLPNIADSLVGLPVRRTDLADRRANPSYSYANSLKKIHYPTGGYRQFLYEGNIGLVEQGPQIMPDEAYVRYQSFDATSSDFVYSPSSSVPEWTHNFTVNSSDGGTTFNFSLTGAGYGNFRIVLTNTTHFVQVVVNTFYNQFTGTQMLQNGSYRLDFYYDLAGDVYDDLYGSWSESTLGSNTIFRYGQPYLKYNMNLGGIRVKEIDDYDHVSGKTYSTKYKYTLFSDSTVSSGLQPYPLTVAHYGNCAMRECTTLQLYPKSCYPMAAAGGSYVYYPEVTTYQDGNGSVQREYSFAFDGEQGAVDITQYPVTPPQDNGWQRSRLMIERHFDQNKNLLKKTLVSYPYITSSETGFFPHDPPQISDALVSWQTGWKIRGYFDENGVADVVLHDGCWNQYTLQGQFVGLGFTIDSLFSPNGNTVTRTENYYYTDLGLPYLKQQKVYINNNKTREVTYKYAFNADSVFKFGMSAAEKSMKSALVTAGYMQPIETVSTLTPNGGGAVFTEGVKMSLANFNGTKIHLSKSLHFTTMNDSLEQDCSRYDTYGNLCEQYKAGDVRAVYLWGYNNTLPVAKITGSDYATCLALVTPSVLQIPSGDQALRDEINKIRVGLAGTKAQVTTYTYLRMVGMSSQVDPSGNVVYYEYDNHGRLLLIRDQHRNVLKKYSYNVINPQ
jgi:YD repeat-containing protein